MEMDRLQAHLVRAWEGLGGVDGPAAVRELLARYEEPWRAYHTREHLAECLEWLEPRLSEAARPDELLIALAWHDAVYQPRCDDNEAASAQLAECRLAAAGVAADCRERIAALILATRHEAEPAPGDAAMLVDADLSILGSSPPRYEVYAGQIRREYAFVPEAAYRRGRAEVLRGFLARPCLYATPGGRATLEAPARRNLKRELDGLLSSQDG